MKTFDKVQEWDSLLQLCVQHFLGTQKTLKV